MRFESEQYQRLMEEFILFGGYPGVVREESREDKMRLLKEIYTSYVQKDISDFLKIEDIAGFNRLVQFMAGQSGGLCKINEVAKNIRLSRYFVERYLFALEETYVLAQIRPYFVNLGKAIIKSPKYYFCDPGIKNAVFRQFEPLKTRSDAGALVESFVFSELMKSVDRDRLWFYRTTAGSEADFLLFKGNDLIPIEVKYSTTRQRAVPKIFSTLNKHTGVSKAIVITKDHISEEQREGMYVAFRPAWSAYCVNRVL
jgi:predicted AAA+ superfamily ATPase